MFDVSVSQEVEPKARQIVVRRQVFDLVKSTAAFESVPGCEVIMERVLPSSSCFPFSFLQEASRLMSGGDMPASL